MDPDEDPVDLVTCYAMMVRNALVARMARWTHEDVFYGRYMIPRDLVAQGFRPLIHWRKDITQLTGLTSYNSVEICLRMNDAGVFISRYIAVPKYSVYKLNNDRLDVWATRHALMKNAMGGIQPTNH